MTSAGLTKKYRSVADKQRGRDRLRAQAEK